MAKCLTKWVPTVTWEQLDPGSGIFLVENETNWNCVWHPNTNQNDKTACYLLSFVSKRSKVYQDDLIDTVEFVVVALPLHGVYGLTRHGICRLLISGVHTLIQWSLTGSYICFTTTSMFTVDLVYCWNYVQQVKNQTMVATPYNISPGTLLYLALNMHLIN